MCQAIADLAFERGEAIQVDEFRTLNRCLDNGIADAVAEYAFQRNSLVESNSVKALNERLGFLAHELRNLIHTATLAVMAIKGGNAGVTGATGALLDRSLIGMRNLIDRSLADVRITAGMPPRAQLISLADFVADVKISASLEAHARQCEFTVGAVDAELALDVDREMLFSAVGNLLQNAFKFTQWRSQRPRRSRLRVCFHDRAASTRAGVTIKTQCGWAANDPILS